MDLMKQYEIMSDTSSIPALDKNVISQVPFQDIVLSNLDSDYSIHSLNKDFVIIFWRTTPDCKVVGSLDFSSPLIAYVEEGLTAGMSDMHRHDYIEIAYVVKGEFSQLITGKKRTFPQGSICIIDRNSEHADYIENQDNFVIFLGMKEDFFDELLLCELDDNVQKFIRKALLKQKNLKQFLQFTHKDGQDVIYPLIEQIVSEKYENKKGSNYIIKGLMIRLFDILIKNYNVNLTSTQLKKMSDLLFTEVEEYLRKNYKNASLKEISRRFHFQEDYFSRLIKKYTGSTYLEFLRKIRMSKAEEMLLNTRMTVSSIIESVCYENRHHFYKIFFEIYNMTSEQYRWRHGVKLQHET